MIARSGLATISDVMIIRTDSPTFKPGSINVIDGGVSVTVGFAPNAVPRASRQHHPPGPRHRRLGRIRLAAQETIHARRVLIRDTGGGKQENEPRLQGPASSTWPISWEGYPLCRSPGADWIFFPRSRPSVLTRPRKADE